MASSSRAAGGCHWFVLLVGIAMIGISVADAAGSAASASPRERVKFDFAWRFSYNDAPAPPSPPLPPPPQTHCPSPDTFPANASGVQCGGLNHKGASTPEACGVECCNDQLCSVWQFSNTSGSAGGCWTGFCDSPPVKNAEWVGGMRPTRVPPLPPPPPPPPDPSGPAPPQSTPEFNDAGWAAVDVPHDMHVDQAPSLLDCPSGCSGRSYLRQHTGWYRKRFVVPNDWKGSHVSIEFEGVFHYSMIYLNGHLVTNHSCGYTSFDVALPAAQLSFGQTNTLAVYVDATSGTGWWYEGGGIFRHVWLVKRAPVHFSTWGVFVAPRVRAVSELPGVGGGQGASASRLVGDATVNVTAVVVSTEGAAVTSVSASIDVFNAAGTQVATFAAPAATVPAGGEVTLRAVGDVSGVSLWTVRAPALYTTRVRLTTASGRDALPSVIDEDNVTTGFRSLHYDAANGFQMNNQEVKVRGFCDHNDFASVGTAVPDRINLYRAQAARSVGGNGRRTSHNPPNPSMLDIYDRVGVVVMAENRDFFAGQQFYDNMGDLVRRDRNHPSVTIWSFCNEGACSAGGQPGEAGAGFRNVTYEFDGTRPVLGNMVGNQPEGPLGNLTDVQGFSHAPRSTLAAYHAAYPDKPMFESECCSCNTQRGENRQQPGAIEESFNADCLSTQTNASQGVPWVSGGMIWTLFDYYGEPSFGGWPHVSSTFGSFDLAGFAKPAMWWYKSFWLLQVPDNAADKPFATPVSHTVRIVESWEPAETPQYPANLTDMVTCQSNLPGQRIGFSGGGIGGTGTLTDNNGKCIDGNCANVSSGACSQLLFRTCVQGAASQQWTWNERAQFVNKANGGCLNVWEGGEQSNVGIWTCSGGGSGNDQWNRTAWGGLESLETISGKIGRCLTNGVGGGPAATAMDVHVYSDLPSVELFVNGVSAGRKEIINPGRTPTEDAQSWAEFPQVQFSPGNLTAVGRDESGAVAATHAVHTSGKPAAIVLSIDAPSPVTGTGSALLLDGQDTGLVRATVVDGNGRHVADAVNNVTFDVVSGPGRIVGAHNGDPTCHEPNQAPWHSAYHGLVRAVVTVTEDSSSPACHRARLAEIDADGNALTRVAAAESSAGDPVPIVVRARSPGLPDATVQIATSNDPSVAGVMAVAAASAGKPVVFS